MLKSLVVASCLLSCQITTSPAYPVTPKMAVDSTYEIQVSINGTQVSGGTAWIGKNEGVSYLVTAGHVCSDSKLGLVTYEIKTKDGDISPVVRVKKDSEVDLCLLKSPQYLGPEIPISPAEPEYGERVWYVGAPSLYWPGNGEAPMIEGRYSGGKLITSPVYPGASGSAVLTDRGVVGVAVGYYPEFHHLSKMSSRSDLIKFLE